MIIYRFRNIIILAKQFIFFYVHIICLHTIHLTIRINSKKCEDSSKFFFAPKRLGFSTIPKLNKSPPPLFSCLWGSFEFPVELKLNNEFERVVTDAFFEPVKRLPDVPLNKRIFCLFSSFFSYGLSLFLLIKLLNIDSVLFLKLILFPFLFFFYYR